MRATTVDAYLASTEQGDAGRPLVFAIHGTGGSATQLLGLSRQLVPGAAIVAPRGDVSEHGAARFFRRLGEGRYDMEDVARRTAKMAGFIAAHKAAHPGRQVFGFGYSNGVNTLASVVMARPDLFDRLALLHPLIPGEPEAVPALAGNVQTIRTGDVQLMSAGEGIAHSEWNASETQPAHFLQIWMIPDHQGGIPSYAQAQLPERPGEVLVAGGEGSGALLPLRSASLIRLARGRADETLQVGATAAQTFVHVVSGLIDAEGERISAGDGLQLPAGETASLRWITEGAALVFGMPARRRLH